MKPKIRLKGFSGEWKESTIGNLFSFKNGLNKGKEFFGHGTPIINYTDVYKNRILKESLVKGKVELDFDEINRYRVQKGDVFFTRTSETPEEVGFSSVLVDDIQNCSFSGFVLRARPTTSELVPEFCGQCFSIDSIRNAIKSTCTYTTRALTNGTVLSKISLCYPSKDEQIKIASYFQHLDSLIQSTTKKIESLIQVKAASLQSMFPQEGETIPRVRFKGFEGEWSICPLKDFAKKSTEKNTSMDYTITLTNSAEYGVINQRDFFDHDISNDDHINGYYVIHHDDFVYNPRVSASAPVGPINRNLLGYAGVMSPLYLIFKVDGIDKDFLSYYFKTILWHNYMKLEGNTGARFDRLAISDEQFFNMPIYVPKDEKEQQTVASFFTNLDSQITLQTQRLEKLKQIKSACLDNMFV